MSRSWIAFAALAIACDGTTSLDCSTAESIDSVSVMAHVTDRNGDAVEGAWLTWVLDQEGGDCDEDGAGWYACGDNLTGEFTVAVVADGFQNMLADADVELDGCDVQTEELNIILYATD